MHHKLIVLGLASQLLACIADPSSDAALEAAASQDSQDSQASQNSGALGGRFPLRVSLYPWIPEPDSFVAWIEADFEAKHPNVDLIVRPLVRSYDWEPGYVGDLAYEPDKAITALTDEGGDDFQHLAEIDTLTLGTLAAAGAIAPFTTWAGFLPAAAEAVRWDGRSYGVPHWTCGYFVISENPDVREADNAAELRATLAAAGTARVDLAGDLEGSWDSISVYLDAYRDTYPRRSLSAALAQPALDPAVAQMFRELRPACTKDGVNYCADDAVDLFATGGADALIGFSERLNPIFAHPERSVGTLHIAAATLGGGDAPTAFVDALVLSPACASLRCQLAARAFAAYYVSDETFETALLALDAPSGLPRYLLPSTHSAFRHGQVGEDRLYQQLEREVRGARSLPNTGVPEARAAGVIRQQMREAMGL